MTELIAHARALLNETTRGTVSAWPRAAALLARQQLEGALVTYWHSRERALVPMNMRVQLACLQVYASDPQLASDVAWAWYALTRATHHHPYELDPTRDELSSLIDQVERLSAALLAGAPIGSPPGESENA